MKVLLKKYDMEVGKDWCVTMKWFVIHFSSLRGWGGGEREVWQFQLSGAKPLVLK